MHEFQSIPGLAGRIFGGGGGGGAEHRRIRGYPGGVGGQEPPAKCPRCESTNTKFCYYNNYNLSQPRHFCKSCRRYWTKGGVLRNVPVGGGCRKSSSKRSSSSKKSSKESRSPPVASHSSSDSSGLTAATTSASASASASASFSNPAIFPLQTSNLAPISDFDHTGPEIFPDTGRFTSLMATAASMGPAFLGLSFSDPPPQQKSVTMGEEIRMSGLTAGLIDQTVRVDLPAMQFGRIGGGGGLNGLDWPGEVDPALFDLSVSGAVDLGTYWNQGHWGDADPSLYLP